jgi:16S rRNA (guanine966-N2)-methyltransferase
MTRIIAGDWRGRRLATPRGSDTRPTSDRVREALFSSLESELGGFDGLRVLDLYAGSGALGLEALSRGAERADFVEKNRAAAAVIGKNIAELGVPKERARVHVGPVARFLDRLSDGFDLIFLDPPYSMPTPELTQVVAALPSGGLVVVERSSRDPFAWPDDRTGLRERAYGETTLWYGR